MKRQFVRRSQWARCIVTCGAVSFLGQRLATLPGLLHITALCLFAALSHSLVFGQAQRPGAAGNARSRDAEGPPQALPSPKIIKIPVIDGKGLRFTRFSTENGLSQTRVSQIVQDDLGFMWFGTQYGLNRFDGYKFKIFKNEPGRSNSLSGVFIYSLFKDRSGALWIGCDGFLDKFEPITETFIHYRISDNRAGSEIVPVTHISQDHSGSLWLSTTKGLYSFDPATERTARYGHDADDSYSLSSNDIKFSGEDRAGKFWVATSEGLEAFDSAAKKVTLRIPQHEPRQISFYEDSFGVFWIISDSGGGLATLDRKTNRLTLYSIRDREFSPGSPTGVTAILEDRDRTLWIGTLGNGLLKFDRAGRRFIRYRNTADDSQSLAQNSLTGLSQDREGNIWVSLHMMGPNRFSTKPPLFEKFMHEPGNANSLSETMANAIYEDRSGILWISSIGALNRIDRGTGQYTFYRIGGPNVDTHANAMIEDGAGVLWVGTAGHGLNAFNRSRGSFKAYRHNPTDRFSLSDDWVTRLLIDHNGALWAATFDGLNRFDPATSQFSVYKFDPLSTAQIYIELKEDPKGIFWVGSHALGLLRFDPKTKQFTSYKHDPRDPTTLSNDRVTSVHFDRFGAMWVGTQNGLNKFDPETGKSVVFYESAGLPGNLISCILDDADGNLWMSTNNGLAKFDPRLKTVRSYTPADGLPGADLSGWGACFKSASGEMFFGGFSGGIAFHPQKVVDDLYVPPVVFTDFRLSGEAVKVQAGSPLKRSISYTTALSLSHNEKVFSLEFSALSYFNPSTNRYRYKLEGLDSGWHEVGSDQRLVSYTTLPANTYTFRVQGATSRGGWSEPSSTLTIEVLAPWWNTWYARTLYIATILMLGWCGYRYRLRQITHQYNLRLEERIAERTRIAQELHDTLLQGILSASMQLHVATNNLPADSPTKPRFMRVLKLMGQVIEEGRNAIRGLRLSQTPSLDLGEALAQIQQEFSIGEGSHFRVVITGDTKPLPPALRDEVYSIGREALINAFRHSRAQNIKVELDYDPKHFRLLVHDDGQGIHSQVLQAGLDGHWGLAGMRERAEKLGGRLNVRSRAAAGTEIELSLPGHIAFRTQVRHRPRWFRT